MDDELLKLRREELKARLLRAIEQDELKRSTYTVSNDWVGDIFAKEEKERFEYIEKNYEFIEQKILSRTPTPKSDCLIPKCRFGYSPLYESLDIILYIHDKLLETRDASVYSQFEVDGALLYLVTDDRSYHITLLFYNDDKAKLFYQDRRLSEFECHPSNCASITTINFEKKEKKPTSYLFSILDNIFHISPFQHIEPTFKLVKIKY